MIAAKTVGSQPLSIGVRWLPLSAVARRNPEEVPETDQAELNELSESTSGYHGTLNIRNKVTGNLCAGHRVLLVVSQIPVVGPNSNGLRPVVTPVNVGINVEITT
ncbi:MAG: hypothetical protein P8K08_19425 [Fuerstiella sp.]|jgi:hypothetical protein|nr:hypothetical protein [Fuerstiella sp.]